MTDIWVLIKQGWRHPEVWVISLKNLQYGSQRDLSLRLPCLLRLYKALRTKALISPLKAEG
jgi:hypothetical protein